jgi:superfamily II DNA or RNA helicase
MESNNIIDKMISEIDIKHLRHSLFTSKIEPRDYQWLAYKLTGDAIREKETPAFVTASVGAGKTVMIGCIAKRFEDIAENEIKRLGIQTEIEKDKIKKKWRGLIISRQGEIIEQDARTCWEIGVNNSIFCASIKNMKSTAYNVIVGSEGTVVNALTKKLANVVFSYLLIDEAHEVSWEDVISDNPSTQYGIIIKELQIRCKAAYNRELIIIGYTGTPMRKNESILGDFWKKEICNISTDYLVDRDFLVPTIFGNPVTIYNLDEFKSSEIDGIADFSIAELAAMQNEITKQKTKTQEIMEEVVKLTKERNGVLITCAGMRHCQEAAEHLPIGSYAIVTEKLNKKDRAKALKDAYNGDIKYVLQIGCLTTGVDIPFWDTSVILRKIRSLTLLKQLLGRGMRKLKPEQIDADLIKHDHLVLDYTDTMHEIGELYFDPILEKAELSRAKRNGDTIPCPKCGAENSVFARRCIGKSKSDERCEYFFRSRLCEPHYQGDKIINKGCNALNDPCARYCRICDNVLIDPNLNLTNKHYQKGDFHQVHDFNIRMTNNGEGLLFEYKIDLEGKPYTAREVFWPSGDNLISRNAWKSKGIFQHVKDPKIKSIILKEKTAAGVLKHAEFIAAPRQITHRINSKNRDIVHRKIF